MATSTTTQSTALTGKIATVLASSYTDPSLRTSLSLLDADSFQPFDSTARRDLSLTLAAEVRRQNAAIIADFGKVGQKLQEVCSMAANLQTLVSDIKSQIADAKKDTAPVAREASSLLAQKTEVETKIALLSAFKSAFIMPPSELTTLTSTAEPVDTSFFAALSRAKQIHSDCSLLLSSPSSSPTLGTELMESQSRHLSLAYQKLQTSVQRSFRTLSFEEPQITPLLRHSLRALAERPEMFSACLDSLAAAREHVMPDAFHVALVGRRDAAGDVLLAGEKPIEMAAGDPLRYVGDMLAWVHAAVAGEREVLESIFAEGEGEAISATLKERSGLEEEGEGFEAGEAIRVLLNHNVRGVARNLRQRIEAVIRGSEEAALSYQLSNLLLFYRQIFERILSAHLPSLKTPTTNPSTPPAPSTALPHEPELCTILADLSASSLRQFRLLVHDDLLALQSALPPMPPSLSPPPFLTTTLTSLATLLRSFSDSTSTLTPTARADAITPILSESLTPFLNSALELVPIPMEGSLEATVYSLNCLLAAGPVLSPYEFTHEFLRRTLSPRVGKMTSALIRAQHGFLLEASGVEILLDGLAEAGLSGAEEAEPAPREPTGGESYRGRLLKLQSFDAFSAERLVLAAAKLDEFLPRAVMALQERVRGLGDGEVAERVTRAAVERFLEDFEFLEGVLVESDEAAVEEMEGSEDGKEGRLLRELYGRTGGEVRVLLS